ncbi:MAG: 3-deoxy-8-phosphooctulonate synthase [Silvanigrellales bacterium]|nr:3-deoxy-8-phosphooctulonate synthase [Silvanigrellales bacterium]
MKTSGSETKSLGTPKVFGTGGAWDGVLAPGVQLGRVKPVVMAGPCMFESWELGLEVGRAMKAQCEALGFSYVFKSSYDKANRTSKGTERGPGLQQGLEWLARIREELGVPVLTDVHSPEQAREAGAVVDVVQIPAFLCEQRELLVAAAATGKVVQVKKGQHASPEQVLRVARFLEACGNPRVILCERGTSLGYNNLVFDPRNLLEMAREGHAVCFDGTHAAQLPGAGQGVSSGLRHVIPALVRAAVAVGVDAVFLEVHTDPDNALSDAATQLPLTMASEILERIARLVSH